MNLILFAWLLLQSAVQAGGGGAQALANPVATPPTCEGITGTYTTCFDTVQNPISSPWTSASVSGYNAVQVTSLGAQSTSGEKGIAVLTGVSLPDNQSARFLLSSGFNVGVTGVCVRMDTSGNGYCFLVGTSFSFVLTAGSGGAIPVTGCPHREDGHIYELSAVGVTLTCSDLTAGTSATGTDSTYTFGSAGFLIDDSADATIAVTKFGAN